MNNKLVLGSLALDLRRSAIAYYRGSIKVAERFFEEALKRKEEVNFSETKPYLIKLLNEFENIRQGNDQLKKAEDALMYSVLFQNAALDNAS